MLARMAGWDGLPAGGTPGVTATPDLTATPTGTSQIFSGGLIQAYPMPASTAIHFQVKLERAGAVNLTVINLAGERIAEIKAQLPAGGGEMTWDCGAAAPGVYIAHVRVDGVGVGTVKMAVVR